MNIFISHSCPRRSAEALDSKRVVKMILESTQMLCTAINEHSGKQITPYKSTHINHPSNVWCRLTQRNWLWLFDHAARLCTIYRNTYSKTHKCQDILNTLSKKGYISYIPEGPLTAFPNCTTNKKKDISFKHLKNTTEAYRQYLIARWNTDKLVPKWTNRPLPKWLGLDKDGKYCYIGIDD